MNQGVKKAEMNNNKWGGDIAYPKVKYCIAACLQLGAIRVD